ncbi:hypothetical protein [Pelagibacterium lacus]|uniref:Uncharacterized protein n=1 Tax=Pelagibacterium lacus TaxID=2282655 RepID=A0A369W453_9HYPH|nr:hypothetical protein [Pelagibacterium lacus]RDE08110.1 hypothetical protein DVH29_13145 [Pelagibacterium lacus]
MRYKVSLRNGQVFEIEDKRPLAALSIELCDSGFIVVNRVAAGYSDKTAELSLFERAVSSIEPIG